MIKHNDRVLHVPTGRIGYADFIIPSGTHMAVKLESDRSGAFFVLSEITAVQNNVAEFPRTRIIRTQALPRLGE